MIIGKYLLSLGTTVNCYGFGLGFDVEFPHLDITPADLSDPDGKQVKFHVPGYLRLTIGPLQFDLMLINMELDEEEVSE